MKILEHIKTFSQQYLVITTFIGIVWGGFLVYDNWKHNNINLNTNVKTIIDSQMEQKQTDSLLLVTINDLRREYDEHIKYNEETVKQLMALQKSYIKYISNDDRLTKTDFLKYMEGLTIDEKKKFGMTQNFQ